MFSVQFFSREMSTRSNKRDSTPALASRAVKPRTGTPEPSAMVAAVTPRTRRTAAAAAAVTAATMPRTMLDEAGKQPRRVNAYEAESDEVPAPAVFTTTCLAKMVFAVAGAVWLALDDSTAATNDLLLMLNENREQGRPALTQLPGLVELFATLGVPIALTDKGGSTTRFPPGIADETLRRALSHNGRGTRIGSTLLTVDDPSWTTVSARDARAGAHIHLGTMGFRRFGPWKLPRLRDVDRQLGARTGTVHRKTRKVPGDTKRPGANEL
jgi:hypothetical protein